MAFNGAWKDVLSGQCDLSFAIGVEKTYVPNDPARTQELFEGGIDQMGPKEWHAYYATRGKEAGKRFSLSSGTVFMDTSAMQAAWHMITHGTAHRQSAIAASRNPKSGSLNPKAQYRFECSVEDVLADRPASYPLTRAMCAPVGARPFNLSGGLVSKGHTVGATGLSMIHELTLQLRGEGGARQAPNVRIGMAENGGGVIGFDEAVCSVVILECAAS